MSLKNNILYMSEDTKNMVSEVSTLLGVSQSLIKEIFEYMLLDFAVKLSKNPDQLTKLDIPYVGSLYVKYKDDELDENGELNTIVDCNVALYPSFKKLVGDIHDEGYTDLIPVFTKKIEQAIMVATSDE